MSIYKYIFLFLYKGSDKSFNFVYIESMFRRLQEKDYNFFSIIVYHSTGIIINKNEFMFYLKSLHSYHQVWIMVDVEDKIITAGTILFQKESLPEDLLVANIYNMIVLPSHENNRKGNELCQFLIRYASRIGCSKTLFHGNYLHVENEQIR